MTRRSAASGSARSWLPAAAALCLCLACAGPGPRYAPVVPADDDAPGAEAARGHLLLILDSIPFQMAADARAGGRFAAFGPPAAVISPFPVMTDLALADFFHTPPCPGLESAYVRDGALTDAADTYIRGENMPWHAHVDYALDNWMHGFAYTDPPAWFDHELGRIQRRARAVLAAGGVYVGYVVGTSAWGSRDGRNGHQAALLRVDRLCRALLAEHPGLAITLMSDHGHALEQASRISLRDWLVRSGYRAVRRLQTDNDVIVPEWGNVTYAAIHTRAPRRVAGDVLGFEGVALAMYREGDAVVVLSRAGEARVQPCPGGYRYAALRGDPLELKAVAGESGCLPDDALPAAPRPDVLRRIWRAFDGLTVNPPDVLVTLAPGWFAGSRSLSDWIRMQGVHGNLLAGGSLGFCMTTAGNLPAIVRMDDLADELRALGLPVPTGAAGADATGAADAVSAGRAAGRRD